MIGKKINQLATELAPTTTDLTIIGDPVTGVSKKITLEQLGAIFGGAVSFYTNLASFPATGVIDIIYCAKDTKKLYLWSGSAYVEVFPSQSLLDTYQLRSEKGVSNGYASLDVNGKVPIGQLPNSIMEYKGTWNAATNTPTLANGTGDTGDVYICNVAGTVNFGAGSITFAVGDYVVYSGTIWQRSSGAVGTVTSVAASITGNAIGITGSPVTTSGTLAFAFGGNSTQYINGAGNLVTFPGVINEAQNLITEVYNKTGATLTKGTVVYINGGQGNLPSVTKALATGDSTSAQTYGIVRNDITNNNNGYVVVAGRISDLDTQAYTEGTQLYLSPTTAGTYTSTKPYAPNHLVYVGIVVRAHPTQGVIEVKIQNGYELDELHNVAAQTPSNNDGLFWEASTSLWKNKSISTILGYTPQAQLNGTGFVKASGTTITYDNSTYVTTDTFQTISASKTFAVGFSLASAGGTNQLTSFVNTNSIHSGSAGSNIFGFNNSNNIYFGKGLNNGGVITYNNAAVRFYALPDADGTIALVGGSGVGTVTSVAALTLGTSGTDLSSTVANGTTTPVITLNVPTASATNRGVLSAADWTKFNNNIPAGTPATGDYVFYNGSNLAYRNFIATTPLSYNSSTATFSISQASGSANGFLSSTDWTTFNNKQNALTNPVTGTGITNYLPKFTGASTIGNSIISEGSGVINIGTTASATYGTLMVVQNSVSAPNFVRGLQIVHPNGTGSTGGYISMSNIGSNLGAIQVGTDSDVGSLVINPVGGNLGLGVTPSAWSVVGPAIEFTGGGFIASQGSVNTIYMGSNHFYNGTNFIYKQNGFATQYQVGSGLGNHQWYVSTSGTAGNAISFTQAMTLNASGNLSIGNTNDTFKLDVTGTGRFTGQLNGSTGVNVGSNALGTDRMFQVSGTAFTSGGNQFGAVINPTMGTLTTVWGLYLGINCTSATTGFGIYIAGSGGTVTNRWGLYQDGGSDRNYFAGNVGIGITNPLGYAKLSLGTGTGAKFLVYDNGTNIFAGLGQDLAAGNSTDLFAHGAGGGFLTFGSLGTNGLTYTEWARITNAGNLQINGGSIQTGAPTNGTAQPWRLGDARSGAISTNSYIIVSVNGTTYSIPALNGLP